MPKDHGPGNIYKTWRGACYVCSYLDGHEEMVGTDMQPVGKGLMRHRSCEPGSPQWAAKFPKSFMANPKYVRARREKTDRRILEE